MSTPRASASAGVRHAYRAELSKLLAQPATRAFALICALAPFAFAAVLALQNGLPADTVLGVWVHSSGSSFAFVVLGFCAYLGFPLLAGVIAGDAFSSEDRYGTWKSVLTRSSTRGQLFAGKCLATMSLATALLLVAAVSSLLAGLVLAGGSSMVGLSGNVVSAGNAIGLLALSWLLSLPPLLALVSLSLFFSAYSRSGIVGVVGPVLAALVMQLLSLVGTGSWMHAALLTTAFTDWHGLLASPRFYAPTLIETGVSLLWLAGSLAAAWACLRRRDFAGPPLSRSAGWRGPARTVVGAIVVIGLLGLAGGLGPAPITQTRLQRSLAAVFERLTVLQLRELGRTVPPGAELTDLTSCYRHTSKSVGPGDDWSCAIALLHPAGAAESLQTTTVTYDTSVKSEGCYKAQAPPSFVGSQTMTDTHGHSVVNPLFVIYGCFDTTGAAAGHAPKIKRFHEYKPTAAQRRAEKAALRRAEEQAGPKVMREIREAERQEQKNSEGPERAPQPQAR